MPRDKDGIQGGVYNDRPYRYVEWPDCVAKPPERSRLNEHHETEWNPNARKQQILLSSSKRCTLKSLHPQKRFREDDQCNVYHDRENKHQGQAVAKGIPCLIDVSRADGPCNEGACGGRDGHRHRANRKD